MQFCLIQLSFICFVLGGLHLVILCQAHVFEKSLDAVGGDGLFTVLIDGTNYLVTSCSY